MFKIIDLSSCKIEFSFLLVIFQSVKGIDLSVITQFKSVSLLFTVTSLYILYYLSKVKMSVQGDLAEQN